MALSIKDIDSHLELIDIEELQAALLEYDNDERKGVINLIKKYKNKIKSHELILQKYMEMSRIENKFRALHYRSIAGVDEVGRGPLAGPVVTAAVILPDEMILGIDDSKKLSAKKREELFEIITDKALDYAVGITDVATIDDINILQATLLAMQSSINQLKIKPDIVLVDAVTIPNINIKQESIIGGDGKSISIAAASIIAKVTRDKMMDEYHELFPEYNFAQNKGYGTKEHIDAIKKYGTCPIHRNSFLKNLLEDIS